MGESEKGRKVEFCWRSYTVGSTRMWRSSTGMLSLSARSSNWLRVRLSRPRPSLRLDRMLNHSS
jgi:hypothetical protein